MWPNYVHPYDKLQGEKLRQEMHESKLMAFYHKNSVPLEDFTKIKNQLQHKNFWLRHYNRSVYAEAIEGTKFASIRPQLMNQKNTVIVIGKGDANLKTLMQFEKKMSGFLLLFGFLEDRLVRRDELVTYSQLGSLDEVRAQLCATLNHGLASVPSHIAQPATMLSLILDQYVKREQEQQQQQPDAGSGEEKVLPDSGGAE